MADKPKVTLTAEEERSLHEGRALQAMTQTPGWEVIEGWLKTAAYHSWVDPREVPSKEEWEWRELNAFHAANNARELLENVQKAISQSEYLSKKQRGEVGQFPRLGREI